MLKTSVFLDEKKIESIFHTVVLNISEYIYPEINSTDYSVLQEYTWKLLKSLFKNCGRKHWSENICLNNSV